VLASADEVVLIDLTPEALIQRLREGKVYPPDRVPKALNSFFRVENLATLREVALREVAEEVESKRTDVPEAVGTRDDVPAPDAPGAVRERLLALVTPSARSRRLVRRASRSAQRLGAELDLLYVTRPGEPLRGEEREGLEELKSLARDLGAELLVEEGDDLAEVAGRVAAERGTTYVMIGQPERAKGLRRLGEPLTERLMRELPGIDLRVLADRPSDSA
jgi:two-component system sensor histidine kinase KdpD